MKPAVQSVLITEAQIEKRVHELGGQISRDYDKSDLVLICVLKGAILFFADLIRTLAVPARYEFVQLASYHNGTTSSGVEMIQGLYQDLFRADVLIVEDIVDTGMTLDFLLNHIGSLNRLGSKYAACLINLSEEKCLSQLIILGLRFRIPL